MVEEEREKQRSKVRQRPSSCIRERMCYFPTGGAAGIESAILRNPLNLSVDWIPRTNEAGMCT